MCLCSNRGPTIRSMSGANSGATVRSYNLTIRGSKYIVISSAYLRALLVLPRIPALQSSFSRKKKKRRKKEKKREKIDPHEPAICYKQRGYTHSSTNLSPGQWSLPSRLLTCITGRVTSYLHDWYENVKPIVSPHSQGASGRQNGLGYMQCVGKGTSSLYISHWQNSRVRTVYRLCQLQDSVRGLGILVAFHYHLYNKHDPSLVSLRGFIASICIKSRFE